MISKHIFTSDVVSGKAFWLNNLQSTGNLVTANGNFTITNDATILGDLTVKGSTTTIDTVTLTVDDHNIELGSIDNPTDSTANGGGITLKGSTDKTFNWSSDANAWESNVGLNVLGGNVGIGTASPAYELEIKDSSNDAYISVISPNVDNAGILFGDTDASARGGIIYDNDSNSLAFRANNNTEKMRIDSAGNVGIGTTNPKSELHIESNVANHDTTLKIENRHGDTGGTAIEFQGYRDVDDDHWVAKIVADHVSSTQHGSSAIGSRLNFHTYDGVAGFGSPRMTINQNGNVGIGTTDPSAKLEVDYIAASQVGLTLNGSNSALNNAIKLTDASNNAITLSINAGKFGINGGNVGIGTTSPGQKLEVRDTTSSNTSTYASIVSGATGNAGITFGDDAAELNGGILFNNTDNALRFFKNGFTEAMRIDSNGNVGIGTTNPGGKLNVVKGTASGTTASASANNIVIDGTSGTETGITLFSTVASGIRFGDASGAGQGVIEYAHGTDYMRFIANAAERMRIDSSGNVDIKANISAAGPTLTLENTSGAVNGQQWGAIHFKSNDASSGASGTRASIVGTSTSFNGDGNITFSTAPASGSNTERMRIDASGNVGIGKSSSLSAGLNIGDGTNSDAAVVLDGNSAPRIQFHNGGTAFGYISDTIYTLGVVGSATDLGIRTQNNLVFSVDTTECMRIDAQGRVGIGGTPSRSTKEIEEEAEATLRNWHSKDKKPTKAELIKRLAERTIGGGSAKLQVAGDGYFSGTVYGKVADVPDHVKSITPTQIANWDAGTGGGGGATTDGRISDTQITHWDTAYGWGNHATAGYQPAGSYAAASHTHSQYLTSSSLNGYATESWVTSNYQPKGSYLTSSSLTGYATESWVNSQGFAKGSFVPTSGNTTISGTLTATDFVATSDERMKDEITPMPVGLIDDIKPAQWTWKDSGKKSAGVIAQQLQEIGLDDFVSEGEDGMLGVNYNALTSVLLAEVIALKKQVQELSK